MITFPAIFRKNFSRKVALSALALLAAAALLYPLLKDNVNRRQAVVAETASKISKPPVQANQAAQAREAYGRLPMSFEANQGQTDGRVKFLARGQGYGLFLTANEAVLSLRKAQAKENARSSSGVSVLKMKLAGADTQARATGVEELPGKSNYFIGNDPQQWRASVPNFARVKYEGVYKGVDLVYYGNQRTLEYDFVVAPGADASQIKLSFDGASRMRIDSKGELALTLDGGEVRQHKPFIYQEVGGEKREIAGRYVQRGEREIGFEVAAYDETKPLVIDPVLVYSTYLGGSSTDDGYGVAVDAAGNAYVTGMTNSLNFPVTPGSLKTSLQPLSNTNIYYSDAFVTKLNPAGTALVYSTYLGGSAAGEIARGIAVDSQGNAYITGVTGGGAVTSTTNDFPVLNAYQSAFGGTDDAFVTKLNPTGDALIFSTYLGGNDSDSGQRILVNPTSGESYVVGSAVSTNFPTTPGAFKSAPCPTTPCTSYTSDAFVTKFSAAGGVAQFSTLLGGDGAEVAYDLALDASANIYLTGTTTSNNFPVTAGAFQMVNGGSDAFVAKMNPQGSGLVYATYLGGGPQSDRGFAIDVDAAGNAYVAGQTQSAGFPTTAGAYDISYNGGEDAFLTKFNESGTALLFSTFFGGAAEDLVRAVVVNGNGEAFIAGQTKSADFPTRNSLQARQGTDIFLTRFNATGSAFLFSTLLGNGGARDVALDAGGNAYLTGEAISIPVTPGAFQTTRGNATTVHDGFVMKLAPADESAQGYSISGVITDLNDYDPPTYTIPITVTLSGTVSRAVTVTLTNPSYSFGNLPAGGTYTITVTRPGFVIDPPSETFPNLGANQTANFNILVNRKPEATITSPASGSSVNAPGPVTVAADATDADGSISKVEFYAYSNELGSVFIGSDTSAPYSVSWTNVLAGDYSLSAIPVDNLGLRGISMNYVQLHVASSAAPTVALTSPVDGASYPAGAYVPVTASVTANGSGAISLVEFYSGSELIGRRYGAPYSINWWAQTSGSFALTAKAYDTGGGVATSAPINVTINAASPSISGRVLERFLPVAGVTVTLSGAHNATVTTGADGRYSFDGLTPNSSYHLTASKDRYTFYPAARDIDLYLYDVQIDFTATRITPVTAQVTSPAPYQQFDPPANIMLEASAESSAGAITKVEFYVTGSGGEMLLGADTTAPYSFAWNNVASGAYWIHVVATDATGETGYSEDVQVTVRTAVTPLRINGQVRDGNGNGIQGLTVTLGGSQTGSFVTIAGGYYVFNNLQPGGNYTVTAPANYTFTPPSLTFTNLTADVLDADFVTASVNQAPTVAITSPSNGAVFTMPADIPISASATDADGSIVKVYFNSGTGAIAEDTVPPYSFVWQVRTPGTYTLTATAIDNSGLRTTSSPVVITVNPPAPTTITGRIVDR
ncbi:MAG: SBBP repeat-containing protein, partial [Acidobacteria bacterium]|nr:SBBP repeat-containing protein [Acidobacteriota bacterium]